MLKACGLRISWATRWVETNRKTTPITQSRRISFTSTWRQGRPCIQWQIQSLPARANTLISTEREGWNTPNWYGLFNDRLWEGPSNCFWLIWAIVGALTTGYRRGLSQIAIFLYPLLNADPHQGRGLAVITLLFPCSKSSLLLARMDDSPPARRQEGATVVSPIITLDIY